MALMFYVLTTFQVCNVHSPASYAALFLLQMLSLLLLVHSVTIFYTFVIVF